MRILLFMTVLFLASSCAATSPRSIQFSPSYVNHIQSRATTRDADSCRTVLFGFFALGDSSMKEAMDKLGGSSESEQLTSVISDQVTTNYILFTTDCIRVTGSFVPK